MADEKRTGSRKANIIIPPDCIDKVAVMFKGTGFHDAVQQCALYGIEQLYAAHLEEEKDKQEVANAEGKESNKTIQSNNGNNA